MKKIITLAAVGSLVLTFMASASYAAVTVCFGATITRIGTVGAASPSSGHRLEVRGGTCNFPANFPVFIHEDLGDAGLATALTALSLGKTITVKTDPAVQNSLVTTIHIEQ